MNDITDKMIMKGIYQVMLEVLNELKRMNNLKEQEMIRDEQRTIRGDQSSNRS